MSFINDRDPGRAGLNKEFYEGNDAGFTAHKSAIKKNLTDLSANLDRNEFAEMGYAKITLKRSAWAKSHRPTKALFKKDVSPIVGAGDIGELYIEITKNSLSQIIRKVDEAEDVVLYKTLKGKDKPVPAPSRPRSEIGTIEKIEPYAASDKRTFSVEQGFKWLSDTRTGGNYLIELFEIPPARTEWDVLPVAKRKLFQSFIDGLVEVGQGVVAHRMTDTIGSYPMMGVRLDKSTTTPEVQFLPSSSRKQDKGSAEIAPFDDRIDRHNRLISFLDKHPLVKKIHLPPIIKRSSTAAVQPKTKPQQVTIPTPVANQNYPKVAVVDGGIGKALDSWVIDRWKFLSPNHRGEDHGTFIAGIVVAGGQLNGFKICPETDGCHLIDIDILPDENVEFTKYFNTPTEFIDELETAVQTLKARCGVRIFNFSINIEQAVESDKYHFFARRLDQIAYDNDVIFIISAGNTPPNDIREEWADSPAQSLAALAVARNDRLKVPAESVRNMSVSALNPPEMDGVIPFAPAAYSCRGPGVRIGIKPDLAHIGGCGTPHQQLGHGLYSITPNGNVTDGCGTSYATPLVAKMLATLDHSIEGDVSRETLMGLATHHATIPEALAHDDYGDVARHMVGFGIPPSSKEILEGGDNQITLVFANRLKKGKLMRFNFTWPPSLVKDGKCLGNAKLTLVSSPPLDYKYGIEFVRVNMDAQLKQEQKKTGRFKGMLDSIYIPKESRGHSESALIEHSLKWSPVKVYNKTFKRGVGESVNWRLEVEYLVRDGEEIPEHGIPFTAVVTISDPKKEAPVFNDMRQTLQSVGIEVADIRTAARILARV